MLGVKGTSRSILSMLQYSHVFFLEHPEKKDLPLTILPSLFLENYDFILTEDLSNHNSCLNGKSYEDVASSIWTTTRELGFQDLEPTK